MRRLDTDQSPQAILDASLVYNQLVEGVMAIAGYMRWEQTFRKLGKLPGLEAGLKLTQRDERRHIAYGTYLGRRDPGGEPRAVGVARAALGEDHRALRRRLRGGRPARRGSPRTRRWRTSTSCISGPRRLEALAVARTMSASEVDASAVEAFEPEELQHVS